MGSNGIRGDNTLAFGPLATTMRIKLKVRSHCDICVGFGTPYCLKFCQERTPEDCPVSLDVERTNVEANVDVPDYDEFPCNGCTLDCPCKSNPPAREALIRGWWGVRCSGVAFERRFWRKDPDVLGTDDCI